MDKISNKGLLEIPTRNNKKLTYKQIQFIDEYMITGNKTQAYKTAYPDTKEEGIRTGISRLMRNELVKAEIAKRQADLHQNAVMSATEIMQMYTDIAQGKVLDQFGLEASLKDRLAALKELARIQIDMASRNQQQDNSLTVKLVRE